MLKPDEFDALRRQVGPMRAADERWPVAYAGGGLAPDGTHLAEGHGPPGADLFDGA